MFFEFLAVLCAGWFSGAASYINLVEHPARLQCGTAFALTHFGPSYHRGTRMQVPLAAVGCAAAITAGLTGAGAGWLIGGAVLGAIIPFTLVVIFPTNHRLLDPDLDRGSDTARRILTRWGRLHAIRSLLSAAAFMIFVSLLLG